MNFPKCGNAPRRNCFGEKKAWCRYAVDYFSDTRKTWIIASPPVKFDEKFSEKYFFPKNCPLFFCYIKFFLLQNLVTFWGQQKFFLDKKKLFYNCPPCKVWRNFWFNRGGVLSGILKKIHPSKKLYLPNLQNIFKFKKTKNRDEGNFCEMQNWAEFCLDTACLKFKKKKRLIN